MRYVIDTEELSCFSEPTARWDLKKKLSRSYSYIWELVDRLEKYGFIDLIAEVPSARNPKVKKGIYQLNERGRLVMRLLDPQCISGLI